MTRLTFEEWGTMITIEYDKDGIDFCEFFSACRTLAKASGYSNRLVDYLFPLYESIDEIDDEIDSIEDKEVNQLKD